MGLIQGPAKVVVTQFDGSGVKVDCFRNLPEAVEYFATKTASGVLKCRAPTWGLEEHVEALRAFRDKVDAALAKAEADCAREANMGACRTGEAHCCGRRNVRLGVRFSCPIDCCCHNTDNDG